MRIDDRTFASLLRCCQDVKVLSQGRRIHAHIIATGKDGNTSLANLLVKMYGKCGSLGDARKVFDKMGERNLRSWNFMIAAYAQNGQEAMAIHLYRRMQMEGVKPNKFTFFPILSASAALRALAEGKRIHQDIDAARFQSDVDIANALVNMYGKCGSVDDARKVFDAMGDRNLISWNFILAAYAQNGQEAKALQLYKHMQIKGVKPNKFTFFPILSASASLRTLAEGKWIHDSIIAAGFQSDVVLANALVSMYGKCGSLKDSRLVFNGMHERDVISWNAIIAAYAQNGYGKEALELFRQMVLEGMKPDRITFLSALDACASLGSFKNGRTIHDDILAHGFESDITVRNALMNMYGKCGALKDARQVFDAMHERDVISWNAMIATYAQNSHGKEALELFRQMDLEQVKPDRITFLTILEACASLASLEVGREIHHRILVGGFRLDSTVRTALVNMYGKCGAVEDAWTVFDMMREQDVVSWTALIVAHVQNGHSKEAIEFFKQMDLQGIKPNTITFLNILNACSYAGLVDAGWHCFISMSVDYAIAPLEEHYVCMSDLLGRAGCLDEAEDLINNMPVQPNAVTWITLLGSCRIHGDAKRGTRAAEHVLVLDSEIASPYVILSNIHAAAGRWDHTSQMKRPWMRRGEEETRVLLN